LASHFANFGATPTLASHGAPVLRATTALRWNINMANVLGEGKPITLSQVG